MKRVHLHMILHKLELGLALYKLHLAKESEVYKGTIKQRHPNKNLNDFEEAIAATKREIAKKKYQQVSNA